MSQMRGILEGAVPPQRFKYLGTDWLGSRHFCGNEILILGDFPSTRDALAPATEFGIHTQAIHIHAAACPQSNLIRQPRQQSS